MTIYADLERAIDGLDVIKIIYDGSSRIVEPHLLGINLKGNVCLSAFQVEGGSGRSFRSFLLERITSVTFTGDQFEGSRNGYNPNDGNMREILARI